MVIIGHTGGRPLISLVLELPGGVALARGVSDVSFRPGRLTDTEADPTIVELFQRNLAVDDARAELERSVQDLGLGLDPAAVDEWAAAARRRTEDDGYAPRVLRGATIGPWSVEVGINHSPARGVVTVHTTLTRRG